MRFKNKVCIITGGSSGIGKTTSLQLAREGAKVAILSHTKKEGNETVTEIEKEGGTALFMQTDLAKPAEIEAAVEQVVATWKTINVLINNAAMMTFKPIKDLKEAE